jgi:hypothetical protein
VLISQKVTIKWHNRSRKYYENLGYVFTKIGRDLIVDVQDLQAGSEVRVKYICDYCNEVKEKPFKNITKSRVNNVKDCCNMIKCMNAKREEKRIADGVPLEKSLPALYPNLIKEWDYQHNSKNPEEFTAYSSSKVWWNCEKGHNWEASIGKRTGYGRGCPYCAGRRVCDDNNLEFINPDLAKEWHKEKNGSLTPKDVTSCSGKKVWWECGEGHEWKAKISGRAWGTGCPVCAQSKGEKKIREWLEANKIQFELEYRFDGLLGVGGESLKYDFAIFDNNGVLSYLLEYDGKWHYENHLDATRLEYVRNHDIRKTRYAAINRITLLRIEYRDFDKIEDLLSMILSPVKKLEGI